MPGIPDLSTAVVEVRDVADLHVCAMTAPEAAGQGFIAAAGDTVSIAYIAAMLRSRLGEKASRVPERRLPRLVVRAGGLVVPALGEVSGNLCVVGNADAGRARHRLGWAPRSAEDAVTRRRTEPARPRPVSGRC
ncbi:hypothetical protein [Streptomyces sp. NPDC000994]